MVGVLVASNLIKRTKLSWAVVAALALAYVWLVTREEASAALAFASEHFVLAFVAAVVHAAMSIARRKARVTAQAENSWLSPLPHRPSIKMRLAFPLLVQLVVLGALCSGIAAAGSMTLPDAGTVFLAACAGFLVGSGGAWLIVRSHSAARTGSQYAFVHRVRERWASAPKLQPLSYWAIARARALNNPAVSAYTMVVVLLAIPMGTAGAVAVALAAGWMVGVYLVLNLTATVRSAFPAAWWLTPTPISHGRFALVLPSRTMLAQLVACVGLVIAISALDKPRWVHLSFVSAATWLALVAIVSLLACMLAMRPGTWLASRLHRRFR
jgi:hypothetical protein